MSRSESCLLRARRKVVIMGFGASMVPHLVGSSFSWMPMFNAKLDFLALKMLPGKAGQQLQYFSVLRRKSKQVEVSCRRVRKKNLYGAVQLFRLGWVTVIKRRACVQRGRARGAP